MKDVDDVVLVLGEHLRVAVGAFDCSRHRRGLGALRVAQARGVEDVRAHPEGPGRLDCDGERVAGDHLDLDAHLTRRGDGRLGVGAWWIEERKHAEELPGAVSFGTRYAE